MSDFEYFATIGMFIAGLVLLVYLFKIRKKLIRKARIAANLAKAKLHYMTRPTEDDGALPIEFEYVGIKEAKEHADMWDSEAYRDRPIR